MAKSYEQIKKELETVKEYYGGKREEFINRLGDLVARVASMYSRDREDAFTAIQCGDTAIASSKLHNSIDSLIGINKEITKLGQEIKEAEEKELDSIAKITGKKLEYRSNRK